MLIFCVSFFSSTNFFLQFHNHPVYRTLKFLANFSSHTKSNVKVLKRFFSFVLKDTESGWTTVSGGESRSVRTVEEFPVDSVAPKVSSLLFFRHWCQRITEVDNSTCQG